MTNFSYSPRGNFFLDSEIHLRLRQFYLIAVFPLSFIAIDVYRWELTVTHSLGCNEQRNCFIFFCMTNTEEKDH